jgi:hypothetical protein
MAGAESGVVVHGEQRGCAAADFDGDGRVDWIDTQDGAATRLFRNARATPGVRVDVQGPPGNPRGFGTLLRLKSGGRIGPARELHSGSGHWSVDSATTVLAGRTGTIWTRGPGGATAEVPLAPGSPSAIVRGR